MSDRGTAGLHRPSYTERIVNLLRLPYALSCLIFAFVFSPVGVIPFVLLETGDLGKSYSTIIAATNLQSAVDPLPEVVAYYAFFYVVVFFLLYTTRYLRLRILQAEPALVPLLSEGEETFHRAFRRTTSSWQPLLLGVIPLAESPVNPTFTSIYPALGPLSRLDFVVVYAVIILMLTNFAWIYFSSIWGVRQIGKSSLRLKSFREDRTLGARPLGYLSLSLAFGYFGGVALILTLSFIAPVQGFRSLPTLGASFVAIVLGVALFFLPLRNVHGKMLEEKQREQKLHLEEYNSLLQSFEQDGNPSSQIGGNRLEALLFHEITERRISAIPTWPFDTGILGRFAAIILSVTAILISRIIQVTFESLAK